MGDKVLTLDVGTGCTGYSLWCKDSLICVGSINSSTDFRALISLDMASQIINLINIYKIKFLIIEDYAYGAGFFNADMAEIIGILKFFCLNKKIKLYFIPPNTIKKLVAGNGRATKSKVKKSIKSLGYTAKNVHEFDALAIYLAFKKMGNNFKNLMYKRAVIG